MSEQQLGGRNYGQGFGDFRCLLRNAFSVMAVLTSMTVMSNRSAAQPLISYISPDIAAPGMAVYMEFVGPTSGVANGNVFSVNLDSLFINNPTSPLRVECVRPSDRFKITFSPMVVSWSGRLLSVVAYVSPACNPNSGDWRLLNNEWRIPVQVVSTSSGTSNVDTVYIVQPTHLGDLRAVTQTVLGQGVLGSRSRRGAMIVDSLILRDTVYTVSTNDPDGIAANGNQGYLPMTLMSVGPIRGAGSNSRISADGTGPDGGPGGGGGGGRFCDLLAGTGSRGGNGFTGGGRGGNSASRIYQSYGIGSGTPLPDGTSNSLNDSRGCSVPAAFESSGGGTGHPFGISGTSCDDGNGCIPEGGVGGASGAQNNIAGAGGGYASPGLKTSATIENGGKVHGNIMIVPLAGGSGGASGNPRSTFGTCGGSGGGGGGALRVVAPSIQNLQLTASGADGASASEPGGGGSGGSIAVSSQYNTFGVQCAVNGGNTLIATGKGGWGYIRCDGPKVVPVGSFAGVYGGPTIDTITSATLPFVISGTAAPNARVHIYIYTETEKWRQLSEGGADAVGRWSGPVYYTGNDSYINILVAQRVSQPNPKGFAFVPTHVLSPLSAVTVRIARIAQVLCDSVRTLPRLTCSSGSVVYDTTYIRNRGSGAALIDSALFADGKQGFSVVQPSFFRDVTIRPGDSLRVITKFQRGSAGSISDRLLVFLAAGINPPLCTIDYKTSVDAVGLVKADVASGATDTTAFAYDLGTVCTKAGGIVRVACKNISSFPIGILSSSMAQGASSALQLSPIKPRLNAQDTAHIVFTVSPRAKGVYYDTLLVTIDSCSLSYRIPVQIRLVETTVIGYSAALESFGYVQVGQTVTRTLVIRNEGRGTDSAYIETLPVVSKPWTISLKQPTSLPVMLAPGDSLLFDIGFTPDTSGYFTQVVQWEVLTRGPSCATTVIFKPNGFGSNTGITSSKSSLNFGKLFQCQRKSDTLRIYNTGAQPITIKAPGTIGGTDPAFFVLIDQPASTTVLAAGDSARYVVEFRPDPAEPNTTVRSAILSFDYNDGTAKTFFISMTATQTRASLRILDAVPLVINSVPVNSSVATQLGVQNQLDSAICITDVRTNDESVVRPDVKTFFIPAGEQRAFQFTVMPKSLADIIDTATIYIGCPCVDSIKIPIVAHPTNSSLLFTPRPASFDTVRVCERPQPIRMSIKNLDVSSQASIDTVFMEGADLNVFSMTFPLWSSFPVTVGSNNTLSSAIVVDYEASGQPSGAKTAQIIIRYRLNNITISDTIPVFAYRAAPPLTPSRFLIDFGSVKQGETTKQTLYLDNIFSQQVDAGFGFSGPTASMFSAAPSLVPIPVGGRDSVVLSFTGNTVGTYTGIMYLKYSIPALGCTDSIPLKLQGEVLPGLNFRVWLKSDIDVKPTDKDVDLVIMGRSDSVPAPLRGLKFRTVVSVPADMFFPRRAVANNASVRIISTGLRNPGRLDIVVEADSMTAGFNQDSTMLVTLQGDALLGSRECDSVIIEDFVWTNSGSRPTTWINKGQGDVRYCTDVCKSGGDRVIGSGTAVLSLSVLPNPVNSHVEFNVHCVESGLHIVHVFDGLGREVLSLPFTGYATQDKVLVPGVDSLGNGTYSVVVQSPSQYVTGTLVVIR